MKNTMTTIQSAAAEQAEMLLNLLRINLEGNQEMLEFNATMAKRSLNLIAKHSKALITNQQLAQNPVWLAELAQDANQACSDYLLGSKALINAMQSHVNALIQAEAKKFGETLSQSVANFKPAPVSQELMDITVRSWTGAAQKGVEHVQDWQKNIDLSNGNGSRLMAAITAQAARSNAATSNKRRSTEAHAA